MAGGALIAIAPALRPLTRGFAFMACRLAALPARPLPRPRLATMTLAATPKVCLPGAQLGCGPSWRTNCLNPLEPNELFVVQVIFDQKPMDRRCAVSKFIR